MSTSNTISLRLKDDYLDDGMRGYLFTMAFQNYKRIANYELDDLLQDGYACFWKCKTRYVGIEGLVKRDGTPCRYLPEKNPDKQARMHFQSLVSRSFNNWISTLALKQPRGWELPISTFVREDQGQTMDQAWENILPTEDETATVGALLANAPKEIKELFALLVSDALDFTGYRRFGHSRHAPRETTNQRFCRVLGLKPGTDIVGQVEAHFLR